MSRAWSTEHDHHDAHRIANQPSTSRASAEQVVGSATPEAVQETAFARGNAKAALTNARARGVEWVRPTDLIARQSSRLARGGIDLHTELARRTRTVTGIERLSDRVRRLPPVSAFGRRGASQAGPVWSGVGMR